MSRKVDTRSYEEKANRLRTIANWILAISSILIICSLASDLCPNKSNFIDVLSSIIIGVAPSVFAGAFVARIIDTPSLINSFKELVVSSLTSDSYLEGLPKDRLQSLKDNINQELRKDSDRVPSDFHLLDNKLSAYINEPFYDYFNDDVICSKPMNIRDAISKIKSCDIRIEAKDEPQRVDNKEASTGISNSSKLYVIKQIQTEFQLINPSSKSNAMADIGIRKSLDFPEGTRVEEMFYLQELLVSIDGSDFVELAVNVESFTKNGTIGSNPDTMTYNSTIGLVLKPEEKDLTSRIISLFAPVEINDDILTKDNIDNYKYSNTNKQRCGYTYRSNDAFSKLMAEFKHSVTVKMKYKIIIPEADNHYTRRLRYPARTLLEQYSCDSNVHIHGQVLGTLVDQKNIAILQSDPRHITIQCRGWLLPGNGTFIVLDDVLK